MLVTHVYILYQETALAQSCSRVYRNSNGEAWDVYNLWLLILGLRTLPSLERQLISYMI